MHNISPLTLLQHDKLNYYDIFFQKLKYIILKQNNPLSASILFHSI